MQPSDGVDDLRAICDRRDGFEHFLHVAGPDTPTTAWHVVDGRLVAIATVQVATPPEICLLVHPDHRRHGIGRELLDRLRAWAADAGANHLLLTCDTRSRAGAAFASAVGGVAAHAEYRMTLQRTPDDRDWSPRLALRRATESDIDEFARIRAVAFGKPLDEDAIERTVAQIADARHRLYLADLAGVPIGTIRLFQYDNAADITSFAVLPTHQGHGFGRQILTRAVLQLLDEGRSPIAIEVETTNDRALGLYRGCGFEVIAGYRYYRLPVR